jgi:hypothetical protein
MSPLFSWWFGTWLKAKWCCVKESRSIGGGIVYCLESLGGNARRRLVRRRLYLVVPCSCYTGPHHVQLVQGKVVSTCTDNANMQGRDRAL